MDKTFEEYSDLPIDLQYAILKSNDEIRNARLLSTALKNVSLYDKIEKDLSLPPIPREIKRYLETYPLAFTVFYQYSEPSQIVGNLLRYVLGPDGYRTNFFITCVEDGTSKRGMVEGGEVFDVYDADLRETDFVIILPNYTPVKPIVSDIIYYDVLTYRFIIAKRLEEFEIDDYLPRTQQAVMKYLDQIVGSSPEAILFVYYFIISSAHLLGIIVTPETEEYFRNYEFEFDASDPTAREVIRMNDSITRIYPLIVEKLNSL
ncbi:Hypothetical protein POVR1_LOCUS276 [uncultured virus]|nr:Hypothetical protein POVR1_LOCUS276 [uncultured virus]